MQLNIFQLQRNEARPFMLVEGTFLKLGVPDALPFDLRLFFLQ